MVQYPQNESDAPHADCPEDRVILSQKIVYNSNPTRCHRNL